MKSISSNDTCVVVFGGQKKEDSIKKNFTIKFFGHIKNINILNRIYSASDLLAVPSIQEVFGLVAAESLLSGTPVISFKETGVEDIIDHLQNGYLAKYLDKVDFANGIEYFINQEKNINQETIRKKAIEKFNYKKFQKNI